MADPELQAVENALNTLALADSDAALQKVLTVLLPALLTALSTPSAAARTKIISSLQHINVRVRAAPTIVLPFSAILSVAVASDAAPITTNVAIQGGYLMRAFRTLVLRDRATAFPQLLVAANRVGGRNATSLYALAVEALASASAAHASEAGGPLMQLVKDVSEDALHAFFAHTQLALRQKLTPQVPEAQLVSVVRFCSEYAGVKQPLRAAVVFPHMLLAAGSGKTALVTVAEDALKKIEGANALTAADPRLADCLFELFLDSAAEVGLRTVLLAKALLRSTLCASCFPEAVEVVKLSLLTPGLPPRLHVMGMQFFSFVVAHAEEGLLEEHADGLVGVMMKILRNETDGSPSFPEKLRVFGYTGLGELIVKVPRLMGQVGITESLFFQSAVDVGLSTEMRASAAQALVIMARVVRVEKGDVSGRRRTLLKTLFETMENESDAVSSARAAAVQWANECFSFADCDARMLNIVAAADVRQDVRQHAELGLSSRRWKIKENVGDGNGAPVESKDFPRFVEMVETFESYSGKALQPKNIAAYFSFTISILRHAISGKKNLSRLRTETIEEYFKNHVDEFCALKRLLSTANQVLTSQSQVSTAGLERATLSVILFASKLGSLRRSIAEMFADKIDMLLPMVQRSSASGDNVIARAVSSLAGIASEAMSEEQLFRLVKKLGEHLEPNPSGVADGRSEEDRRVAQITMLGQVIKTASQKADVDWSGSEENLFSMSCMHLVRRLTLPVESSDVVRTAACVALMDIGLKGPLPILEASRSLAVNTLSGILKLHSSSPRLVEAAANAISRICIGEPRTCFKQIAADALLSICRERKEEEVRFTASESLVRCASGFDALRPSVEESELSSSLSSVNESQSEDLLSVIEMKTDAYEVKEEIKDKIDVGPGPSSIPDIIAACMQLSQDERPSARAGGCVCLFTFLRLLGCRHGEREQFEREVSFKTSEDKDRFITRRQSMEALLPRFQQAFTTLLGDRSDFVQQLASCGVALVYEMCPPKEQKDLVSTLVGSLTAGKSRAASTVPGDQGGLLELGGINTQESASTSRSATYKELCTIAQEMGQPELVYKFMDLAGHTALWNSRRGAALAGSALLDSAVAAEQLKPHVKGLLPRLYVYCYDPTESVRVAMGSVLGAVVKAAGFGTIAEALSANFNLVIDHCLKSVSSRQWRTREAACGALRDAVVSRTWEEVKDLLKDFWYMTLRALDDIKESVRKAAEGTGRALSELSVHLCDPKQVGVEVAKRGVALVIPSVLPAFTHAVDEVRHLATKTLSDVIKSGGSALIPSIPELVEALLEAATELEPQVLNYAEFHVEDREELQNMRVNAASMSVSPLIDSLERLAGLVDESVIERLIAKLVRLSRVGVGIPTRAATARFFSSLLRVRAVIVEPHARRLMYAAVGAAGMELNMTLRGLWCAALGEAARLSGTDDVSKVVDKIVELSESEDPRERSLASSLALGLWSKSSDTARQHGSAMLPIAYMGKFETDEDAKGAGLNWTEVWNEGAPSAEAGLRIYAGEITAICANRLATSTRYRVKRSAAVALGALAEASNESVDVKFLSQAAKALVDALPGHIWDGKIAAIEALGTIASSRSDLDVWKSCDGADTVVQALLKESNRGKREYRLAAIAAASKVLNACRNVYDLFEEVHKMVSDLWNFTLEGELAAGENVTTDTSRLIWETGSDANAVDARNKARKARKALCIAAVTCQEASYAGERRPESQVNEMSDLVSIFESIIRGDWEVRLGALHALKRAISRTGEEVFLSTRAADRKSLVTRIVRLAEVGVTDAKFAAIRTSGLEILLAVGNRVQGKLNLEDLLPSSLVEATRNCRAQDPDSTTQAKAKKVCALFGLE